MIFRTLKEYGVSLICYLLQIFGRVINKILIINLLRHISDVNKSTVVKCLSHFIIIREQHYL